MAKGLSRKLTFLLCLNVVLITALVLCHVELPQAKAQVRAYDYILVPGNADEDRQTVWVLDMRTLQLTTMHYDQNDERIVVGDVLDLIVQFD